MTKSYLTPEIVQILRYVYRYTFADREMIIKQALLFRREGEFQNVIIEPNWLKKQLDKLVYLGLVNRRTFIGEEEYRKLTNSGQDVRFNWATSDRLTCYCLTDRGAGYFKRQTGCTGFIEEYMFSMSPVEVSRRLTCNAITTNIARNFFGLGEIHHCESMRFGRSPRREIVYGMMERADKSEIVIFEPIMMYRDKMIQMENELTQYFEGRADFLLHAVSYIKDENAKNGIENMKITICFVFSNKSEVRVACDIYSRVLEEINEVLLINEPLVKAVTEMKNAPAPFFLVTKKSSTDGTYTLNLRQTFPSFLKRPE